MYKKVVSIIFCLIIGIITGAYINYWQTHQKLMIEDVQVEIIGEKNENVDLQLENISNALNTKYLQNLVNKIIITDKDLNDSEKSPSKNEKIAGMVDYDKKIIYISSKYGKVDTVFHEFYHLLDDSFRTDTSTCISENAEFKQLVNSNIDLLKSKLHFLHYELSSYSEIFVGIMQRYQSNIYNLKEDFPDMYIYIQEIVKESQK